MVICTTMTWEDILRLLIQGEGPSVEFEKNVPSEDDIARELVGFSNTDGGKVIYGLDDKSKHLLGATLREDFESWIKNIAKTHCQPAISVTLEVVERFEKKIVVLHVQEGEDKPYRTDDICYIRDGNISRPAEENEVQALASPWSGKGLNKRQLRAMQIITEHGSITNREYREAFDVSHKTAHIELTLLVNKHLAQSEGAGRSTRYTPLPAETHT
ncbi:MAG: putative DNA binding domain-containing protein [Candidatus Margulisbacteria bacterium]|nr:putative DNA binding domain-containing protein [Candidatus Margulisiibacteriota bacterium]